MTALALGIAPKQIASSLINSDIFDVCLTDLRASIIQKVTTFLPPSLVTLADLYRSTGKTVEYHMYNVTLQRLEVFSHTTAPMMAITTACSFCYNVPYTDYVQSYCGNEYIDSSVIAPVPIDSDKHTLVIISVPDVRAISTFKAMRLCIADTYLSGRILGRQEIVECPERTSHIRSLCTMYYFSVQAAITAARSNMDDILLLLVPFPYTETTLDQKHEMLARWKDYITDTETIVSIYRAKKDNVCC